MSMSFTKPQLRYHDLMQCYVRSIHYNFERKRGQVVMGNEGCTDMSGCIAFFEQIDPKVQRIETGYGNDQLDTVYRKRGNDWVAE